MVEIEERYFPFIFIRFSGRLDEATAHQFVERMDAAIARSVVEHRTVAFCGDTSAVTAIDARFRRVYAEWEQAIPDADFACIGMRVVVAPSRLIRGAITAMGWFSSRVKGIVAVDSIEAALAALLSRTDDAAAAWTPEIERNARRFFSASSAEADGEGGGSHGRQR